MGKVQSLPIESKNSEDHQVFGYKVFGPNYVCLEFKYNATGVNICTRPIHLCSKGFHFCREPIFCQRYHIPAPDNIYALVRASGEIMDDVDKSVCSQLEIIKTFTTDEWLDVCSGRFVDGCGSVFHCRRGRYHREDGPAIELSSGTEWWVQ